MRALCLVMSIGCEGSDAKTAVPLTSDEAPGALIFSGSVESNGAAILADVTVRTSKGVARLGPGDALVLSVVGETPRPLFEYGSAPRIGYVAFVGTTARAVGLAFSRQGKNVFDAPITLPTPFSLSAAPGQRRPQGIALSFEAGTPDEITTLTAKGPCIKSTKQIDPLTAGHTIALADFSPSPSSCTIEVEVIRKRNPTPLPGVIGSIQVAQVRTLTLETLP